MKFEGLINDSGIHFEAASFVEAIQKLVEVLKDEKAYTKELDDDDVRRAAKRLKYDGKYDYAKECYLKWKLTAEDLFFKNLISPSRGVNYTVADLIDKFFDRRNFVIKKLTQCPFLEIATLYGDWDGVIVIELETVESLWTHSLEGVIRASIPYHVSVAGKVTIGKFGTDPQWENEERPEYYRWHYPVTFTGWIGGGEEEVYEKKWEDLPREIKTELIRLTREAIIQRTVLKATRFNRTDYAEIEM